MAYRRRSTSRRRTTTTRRRASTTRRRSTRRTTRASKPQVVRIVVEQAGPAIPTNAGEVLSAREVKPQKARF